MRILMLRPQLELGGVSAHMALLARGLLDRGHSVIVATGGGDAVDRVAEVPVSILRLPGLYPSRPHGLLLAALRISALVPRLDVQLLHSHHRFTTIVGRLVARLTGRPLVVTVHEFKTNWSGLSVLWTGQAVITPSAALRAHLAAHYRVPHERISVVPNAVPLPNNQSAANIDERPVVSFVGRLSPEKGAHYFLESLPLIRQAFPTVHPIIVGDGPEAPILRQRAKQIGFDPDALFLGVRSDVATLLAASAVVVVPSLAESFSLVALEAMHHGRAVVGTTVGGIPEVVRDGETGRLVAPGNSQALADAVVALLRSPEERTRLGNNGQAIARRDFSPDQMVQGTLAVYKSIIKR